MADFDIVIVADPRFSGGTTAAVLADVEAFLGLGLRLGLFFVNSKFLDRDQADPHPGMAALRHRDGVIMIAPGTTVRADLAFVHHPLAFTHPVPETLKLTAQRAVLVAHHPCFRGDGSLEYNPISVGHWARACLGTPIWWAPVSGVVRQQLRSFCPLIRLTGADWGNLFDTSGWQSARPAFSGPYPTVGRHSRPDRLKWPSTAEEVGDSLSAGPDWTVRIMGWPVDDFPFEVPAAGGWDILEFNALPVPHFLESIDVFAYYFSDIWVEAFGRTIVEAMLMERPCLLDPRLEATFGDLATYCTPKDVSKNLERLRAEPEEARRRAKQVRECIVQRVSSSGMQDRLLALRADTGTISRAGPKTSPPLVALRKTIGLARRNRL